MGQDETKVAGTLSLPCALRARVRPLAASPQGFGLAARGRRVAPSPLACCCVMARAQYVCRARVAACLFCNAVPFPSAGEDVAPRVPHLWFSERARSLLPYHPEYTFFIDMRFCRMCVDGAHFLGGGTHFPTVPGVAFVFCSGAAFAQAPFKKKLFSGRCSRFFRSRMRGLHFPGVAFVFRCRRLFFEFLGWQRVSCRFHCWVSFHTLQELMVMPAMAP